MYAVTVGDAVCVAKLIEAGADASIKNNDGDTAMALCKQSKKRYNLIQIIDQPDAIVDAILLHYETHGFATHEGLLNL
mgnify:CR=1 FL=1